jgi:hypothetical protein
MARKYGRRKQRPASSIISDISCLNSLIGDSAGARERGLHCRATGAEH